VQPAGQQARQVQRQLVVRLEEGRGIMHHEELRVREHAHRRHVRQVEQSRDLAEKGAGRVHRRHLQVTLEDLDAPRPENVQQAAAFALHQDRLARPKRSLRQPTALRNHVVHRHVAA